MDKIVNGININFEKRDNVVYFKYKGAFFKLTNANTCKNIMTHFEDINDYPTFDEIITPSKNNIVELSDVDDNWSLYFAYDFLLVELELSNSYGSMEKLLYEITKNIDRYYNQGMKYYEYFHSKMKHKRNNK